MSVSQAALQYDTNNQCGSEQTWRNHHSHGPWSAQRTGENGQRRCHDCLLNICASLNHCISLHRALEMKSKDFQMNEHTMAGITWKEKIKFLWICQTYQVSLYTTASSVSSLGENWRGSRHFLKKQYFFLSYCPFVSSTVLWIVATLKF